MEKILRMRGIKVFRKNPTERLFFPLDISPFYKTRFYEMMKKYSFRLVLRDMIKYQDGFRIQDLTHYCSSRVVQGYCHLLCEMGAIIKNGRGKYRTCVSPLYSFGPTLEWFVAEVFKREFVSPAESLQGRLRSSWMLLRTSHSPRLFPRLACLWADSTPGSTAIALKASCYSSCRAPSQALAGPANQARRSGPGGRL